MVLAIFEAKCPAADDLRDLVAAALETIYPGFTMLDTRLPVAEGVMLILETNGAPRLVCMDAGDAAAAMTNGLQAAEKMQDSRELLCRLYPPLQQAMHDHEVQLSLIVPRVPVGGWAINSRYLKLSVYTFLALNVNGEVGLLLEPVARRDLGVESCAGVAKTLDDETANIAQPETSAVGEEEFSSGRVSENEASTAAPATAQITLNNPVLTDEEEAFFKQF